MFSLNHILARSNGLNFEFSIFAWIFNIISAAIQYENDYWAVSKVCHDCNGFCLSPHAAVLLVSEQMRKWQQLSH